ncbi:ATP-binding response regulator [Vibrio hepatarius]|uniref:histidine kinase n=1 Tax=Vibrio hepatarius TaxID=171383 RepID=A0A0M0I4M7_9VIBR|nr:hybrid sensor histidine kinase/response regulator [Vibrio hepatarius]KOO09270.1 chemotaxis protein CheY [Vibrio hepatarius]
MEAVSGATSDAIRKVYQYAEPNLTIVGWFGAIGFPAYYYIWSYLYPQPYESALLRTFCTLLFSVILVRNYLPAFLRRLMPQFYLVILSICLPFFFSFMMFKNGWNTVWVMSFLASIFLHILLVHQTRIVLLQATGAILAAGIAAYGFNLQQLANDIVWPYVPIFLFTYVFGNMFYFRNQTEHESKVSFAKSFGAGIAHEMRNPLSALKSSVEVVNSILMSKPEGAQLTADELKTVHEVLSDANSVIDNGNEAIDLLLTSIDENRVSPSSFKKHSIKSVIESALSSFAFKSKEDKQAIVINGAEDFEFFGSDTLAKYVLFNLLKNSFYYQEGNDFKIEIRLQKDAHCNHLIFTDNGAGIPPDVIKHVFQDFYTYGKSRSYGLGLPFCKKVMKSLGGRITCRSELGRWTEFTLSFPLYESDAVDRIKMDLMKSKSVLYVGNTGRVSRMFNEHAFYKGFRLVNVDIATALACEEYEFEYDLILIDLEPSQISECEFKALESKLHFTEGRLIFLGESGKPSHFIEQTSLAAHPLDKNTLLRDFGIVLDQLFFEALQDKDELAIKLPECKKTIVIADDNRSVRSYTSLILEQQGFEVIQAQDGRQVLEALEQQSVDLILMDIEMPGVDGFEATNAIRNSTSNYSRVPILAHTGNSSDVAVNQIYQAGMDGYVIKPAGKDVLLGKIADWL